MHDLNLNLFYKTSFDVKTIDPEDDALWGIVLSIRLWMTRKWSRSGIDIPAEISQWSLFKDGDQFTSADEAKSVRFESKAFWNAPEATYWACRITETIRIEGRAPRQWVTEVGFVARSQSEGTVSIVLSYGDWPGYLGPCQDEPGPSIPRIVRMIDGNRRLACSVHGVPLSDEPHMLHAGDFADFWSIVADPARDVPVVFASPCFLDGEASFALDPQDLVRALGPSALVYCTAERAFCNEMAASLPNANLRCTGGAVRVYAARPRMDEPSEPYRHRYFALNTIKEMGTEAFIGMLRRALAQDVHFYETMVRIDVVKDLVRQSMRAKRVKQLQEEALSFSEEFEAELAEDIRQLQAENDLLKRRNEELEAESHALNAKAAGYRAALDAADADGGGFTLERWPLSSSGVASIFAQAYPDRIAFTPRAMETLRECHTDAKILWNAFYDLCEIAYDLHANRSGVDIAGEFNKRSRFEYARSAGQMTRKDAKLMEQYFDEYQGRKINVERHLKNGAKEKDGTFVRIYFGYDDASRRIVVSCVGKHLKNYSTRLLH